MQYLMPGLVVLLLCFSAATAFAEPAGVENSQRARINYMLNCQGCHGPQGAGTIDGAVPAMENFVANFLRVEGGREFLVRVPGSANAALDDTALAELLNWMLVELSPQQMPADFTPYTAAEINRYRNQPLDDVALERAKLINRMQQP